MAKAKAKALQVLTEGTNKKSKGKIYFDHIKKSLNWRKN